MSGPDEVVGLDQSIAYAQHLAAEAGLHGPDGNETYLQHLAAARVTGDGLTSGQQMQDAFAAAAAAAEAHAAHLAKQAGVQEAYLQAPDAGDKAYLTGDTGGAAPAAGGTAEQGKEPPVPANPDDDAPDQDEAFDQALLFIEAATSGHPQQSPPGQDLQHRPIDDEDDEGEQPWMSLTVRRADVCDHMFTACSECLEQWSWGHDLRIADTPVSVDRDAHQASADEFYAFKGDPERQAPPYWVARHGRTVTSQIADEPVETKLKGDDELASATFADDCCDPTPTGPGAPRPGDRIELRAGGVITVSASTPTDTGYALAGRGADGAPFTVEVGQREYEIVRRRAGAGR
jgi:hypothetical protein